VFYQKHMTHHMLAGFERSWIVRADQRLPDPGARAGAGELCQEARGNVTLRDIGFVEQWEIFDMVADHLGAAPPVVDADDILADPQGAPDAPVRRSRHPVQRGDAELAGRAQTL
jgi:hypothetical protein